MSQQTFFGPTVKSRTYFSIWHIRSAAFFASEAYKLDVKTTKPNSSDYKKLVSYSTSAVISSYAALESYINELYQDTYEEHEEHIKELNKADLQKIKELLELGFLDKSKFTTLDKYDYFLKFNGRNVFDKGTEPYQSVELLRILRNQIVHYVPEWIIHKGNQDIPTKEKHKIEKLLESKFKPFQLEGFKGNNFYPDKCFGHGCAEWSVMSVVNFVSEFCNKLGTESSFNKNKEDLQTR